MGTIAPTQTVGTVVLAHQAITHPATVKGAAQAGGKVKAVIEMFHAPVEAAANTNPGQFLVQVSQVASGDEDWATVWSGAATISTADTEPMTATEPVGETVLAVASTTGFVANDPLYVQDTGVVDAGEWARCNRIVSNTSIDLIDGLTNQKDNADVIWNDADIFVYELDLGAIARWRVIFQHQGAAGADCHVKAIATVQDSWTTA